MGLAVPFHRDFTEINLRFYVRRQAVEHPRWLIWPAEAAKLECDPRALSGFDFPVLPATPTLAFAADGSTVTVHVGERIQPGA